MRFPVLCAAAVFGLASVCPAQSPSTDPIQISPEQLLLREATALAGDERFEEAWDLLMLPSPRDREATPVTPARLGWRVASVAGALRNRSDYAIADSFARFALLKPWTEPGRTLSRSDLAESGYWCAWLATEILGDRTSALAWIEEASKADPGSERIRKLKERLSEAERSFPTR